MTKNNYTEIKAGIELAITILQDLSANINKQNVSNGYFSKIMSVIHQNIATHYEVLQVVEDYLAGKLNIIDVEAALNMLEKMSDVYHLQISNLCENKKQNESKTEAKLKQKKKEFDGFKTFKTSNNEMYIVFPDSKDPILMEKGKMYKGPCHVFDSFGAAVCHILTRYAS